MLQKTGVVSLKKGHSFNSVTAVTEALICNIEPVHLPLKKDRALGSGKRFCCIPELATRSVESGESRLSVWGWPVEAYMHGTLRKCYIPHTDRPGHCRCPRDRNEEAVQSPFSIL